jgi:hypothetical protein
MIARTSGADFRGCGYRLGLLARRPSAVKGQAVSIAPTRDGRSSSAWSVFRRGPAPPPGNRNRYKRLSWRCGRCRQQAEYMRARQGAKPARGAHPKRATDKEARGPLKYGPILLR